MPTKRGALVSALLGCLIVGGTAYQTWQFEQTAIELRSNEDRLARQYSALAMGVADLRAAQAAYVAAGQGPDFWMTRFDDVLAQVEAVLSDRQRVGHPDAVSPLTAAHNRIEALRASDRRARNYVSTDQRLLASDVIFVESLDVLGRLDAEIATARNAEVALNRQEAATVREYQIALVGSALVLLLGLVLVAGRRGAGATADAETTDVLTITPREKDPGVQGPRSRVHGPGAGGHGPGSSVLGPGAAVQGPPGVQGSLTEAADVCVDLARLLDGRDLPSLLSRAAAAIGAKGVVLWVIDDVRETLRPSLSHGYSDRMVERLGTLAVTADNVTSVACRTLQAQVMPATSADGSGALAVPLIGTSGCVGVLAAEVTGTARDGSTLPLARVIAAQLAAVITPLPASSAAVPPAAGAL